MKHQFAPFMLFTLFSLELSKNQLLFLFPSKKRSFPFDLKLTLTIIIYLSTIKF